MKWRIHKDPRYPSVPWCVVGWTWIEELDEWMRVHSWQPTHAAAVVAMNSFRAIRPPVEEAPC